MDPRARADIVTRETWAKQTTKAECTENRPLCSEKFEIFKKILKKSELFAKKSVYIGEGAKTPRKRNT